MLFSSLISTRKKPIQGSQQHSRVPLQRALTLLPRPPPALTPTPSHLLRFVFDQPSLLPLPLEKSCSASVRASAISLSGCAVDCCSAAPSPSPPHLGVSSAAAVVGVRHVLGLAPSDRACAACAAAVLGGEEPRPCCGKLRTEIFGLHRLTLTPSPTRPGAADALATTRALALPSGSAALPPPSRSGSSWAWRRAVMAAPPVPQPCWAGTSRDRVGQGGAAAVLRQTAN